MTTHTRFSMDATVDAEWKFQFELRKVCLWRQHSMLITTFDVIWPSDPVIHKFKYAQDTCVNHCTDDSDGSRNESKRNSFGEFKRFSPRWTKLWTHSFYRNLHLIRKTNIKLTEIAAIRQLENSNLSQFDSPILWWILFRLHRMSAELRIKGDDAIVVHHSLC